jgi:16S rRNA (guanine527-N7)-methyltransferase
MCIAESRALLTSEGIDLSEAAEAKIAAYCELIAEWNDFSSLVSAGDLQAVWPKHVADSLSLAGEVLRVAGPGGTLLDIGSGGGFPAIPIKIVLPGLRVVLVERSKRKAGFLQKAIGALGLDGVTIGEGDFPREVKPEGAQVVTARAVEKGKKVLASITQVLEPGMVFLCQSGDPRGELGDTFHVEHVEDGWTEAGLRRGTLYRVRRESSAG